MSPPSPTTSSSVPSSPRSNVSLLTNSDSSFSDYHSSLSPFSSPIASISSKTNAFFASPFSTRPSTPLSSSNPHRSSSDKDASIDSPLPSPTTPDFLLPNKVLSRVFPSRHISQPVSSRPSPRRELVELQDEPHLPHHLQRQHHHHHHHPPLIIPGVTPDGSEEEPTPRPADHGAPSPPALKAGTKLSSAGVSLSLIRCLGQGTFSSVWLAQDKSLVPLSTLSDVRLRKSLAVKDINIIGIKPTRELDTNVPPNASHVPPQSDADLVAIKLTPRVDDHDEDGKRTRTSFIREVEVLRHISHPHITHLLAHLTTSTYRILILPYVPGGDLLSLVNSDTVHPHLRESVLRQIVHELFSAVGWMHSVGIVHRDVKLENILLTVSSAPPPAPIPSPLIKLTDFGLSRFIDLENPWLKTRCGSEAYAAPELVLGGGGRDGWRGYDGRETDAWACGVVLYAMACRRLPFGEGPDAPPGHVGGIEREVPIIGRSRREVEGRGEGRRAWLGRIAKGEWEWPADVEEVTEKQQLQEHQEDTPGEGGVGEAGHELMGVQLASSAGVRRVVGRLLVRDPRKRAKIADLWADEWVRAGRPPSESEEGRLVDREKIESVAHQEVQ